MKKLIVLMAAQAVMLTVPMAAHADVQADPVVAPAPQVKPVAAPEIRVAPNVNLPLSGTRMQAAALAPRIEPVFPFPVRPGIVLLTQNR
jgi:hypothetical protein